MPPMRRAVCSRVRLLVALLFGALLLFVGARPAAARPVIPPEREAEVQALLGPQRLGDELVPGWRLHSIAIERATIRVWVAGPDERFAELTLDHPDYAPPGSRTLESFALTVIQRPPGSEAALAELLAALERNDDGKFWAEHGAIAEQGEPDARFPGGLLGWAFDGLLMFLVLAGVAGVLLWQALRHAPRPIAGALLAVVALGIVLRLGLAPEATLEPWSYTRFMVVARMIYEGPALAWLHPGPVYVTSVVTATVLACSLVAPIPVFSMARYLLDSDRAALTCAGLVAVLPLHIRFSHGDVSSMPSLTLIALAFGMIQAGAREPKLRWLLAMLPLIAAPLLLIFLLRPLNIMCAPLLLATLFIDRGVGAERPPVATRRILAICGVIAALTVGFGVPHLLAEFGQQVREGLSLATLGSALRVLFSFEFNALLNPRFTPPGLTVLAVVGVVDLVRRKRWRLVVFLVGWLLGSLATHAYVVPKSPFMQARYHLHLVLPFVCLAACGVEALLVRLRGHRGERALGLALLGYLLASPLIHVGFIRDVGFNDQREWAWVHGLRETIPKECTIVEYEGRGAGARFARVGAHVVDGMPRRRWKVIAVPEPEEGEDLLSEEVRRLLREPPDCAYWYEGLPCFGIRPPQTKIAPVCAALRELVAVEELERIEFVSRPYDENLAQGLGEEERIVLRLSRARRLPMRPDPTGAL